MKTTIQCILKIFERADKAWAKVLPNLKTKITGAVIIIIAQYAIAQGYLEPGQEAELHLWIVDAATNLDTWLGMAVIYFRGLNDRVNK